MSVAVLEGDFQAAPKRAITMLGEQAAAFVPYLEKGAKALVRFRPDSKPDDLHHLLDTKGIELDEVSRRRVTAVLGDHERVKMEPNNAFSFEVLEGFSFGSKMHFIFGLAPFLEEITLLEHA